MVFKQTSEGKVNRGRPKDLAIDENVVATTWRLLANKPLGLLTIMEIAEASGTSRPAIYRRWNSVDDIAISAFLKATQDEIPHPGTEDPVSDLRSYIGLLVCFYSGRGGRAIAEILGRAQTDPSLLEKFHQRFLMVRRKHGNELIQRGQQEGLFRRDLDSELIIDLYAGPIYFRAIARHAPLDQEFADALAERVLFTICMPR